MLLPLLQNNVLETGAAVATVSGDISNTESSIVAGHSTTITLANDTLVAAGAAFDAQRQNLIDADTSAQSETFGFNNVVRDNEPVTSVTRVSDTVYRIDWSAAPTYDITADEVRTVTVPASALVTSTDPVTAGPVIGVTADVVPGKSKGGRTRKRKRYLVEVDGQFFDADNIAAVQGLLKEAETAAMEAAARDTRNFPEAIRIKPPRIRVKTGSGQNTTSTTLQRDVAQTQQRVNEIYRKAQVRVDELHQAIKRREQREEEEAIISLLL